MANELNLRVQPNTTAVPADSGIRLVYLLISTSPAIALGQTSVPVNLAIVIDKSESMTIPVLSQEQFDELRRAGQVKEVISDGIPVYSFKKIPDHIRRNAPSNLEMVKQALQVAASNLEAHDRFSVVAFGSRANVLASGQAGSNKAALQQVIDTLDSVAVGDETAMAEGIAAGLAEVRRGASTNVLNRIVVLTDGYTLAPERVQEQAGEAAAQNVSISTMGIGSDFNENVLVSLADRSGGNAYFVKHPADIPPALQQELSAVQSVSILGMNLQVKLASGVELRRAHKVRPVISDLGALPLENRQVGIALGNLEAENPPAALLELLVPARPAGSYRVAEVTVSYTMPGQSEQSVKQDALLAYSSNPAESGQQDPQVMNIVERVSAFKLQTRALQEAELGNTMAATSKLQQAATRFLEMGEVDLANAANREAANLQAGGQLSSGGAKELKYATRRLTQRLDKLPSE